MFSYINHTHVFIYIFAVNFGVNITASFLSLTLFVCHFMSPCEVTDCIMSLYHCQFLCYLSVSFSMAFHLHWEIYLWHDINSQDKASAFCNGYNYNLSQTIPDDYGLCYQFCGVSICLPVGIFEFHIIIISNLHLTLVGCGVPAISSS